MTGSSIKLNQVNSRWIIPDLTSSNVTHCKRLKNTLTF
jgi:hypothetical protein